MADPITFYSSVYKGHHYAQFNGPEDHFEAIDLSAFIDKFSLRDRRCLEVGSGRGCFQDFVSDYTGLDLSPNVASYYHKPFYSASAESLPFLDQSFDAIWSITVLEHVANPERALLEMRRVLKPGGLLYLHPAWNCRPWICEGIPVRAYRELTLRQKWVKFSLPLRDALLFRAAHTLPQRLWTFVSQQFTSSPHPLKFKPLPADYQTFWMVDSDACCSLDPFHVIHWFRSLGDEVISHPTLLKAFLSRSEAVIIRIGSP